MDAEAARAGVVAAGPRHGEVRGLGADAGKAAAGADRSDPAQDGDVDVYVPRVATATTR